MLDDSSFDQMFADQIQEIWRENYTRVLTQIRRAQEKGLAELISTVMGSTKSTKMQPEISGDEAYQLVRDFFATQSVQPTIGTADNFDAKYRQDSVLRSIVGEIAEVQRDIQKAQEPQTQIEALIADLFGSGKKVQLADCELAITANKETIPLQSLSSGEKQLLRILLETAAAREHCILIDEPELSMHVDWQHRLVRCMQIVNPNVQIVLATHSPEVMAELDDASIFEL